MNAEQYIKRLRLDDPTYGSEPLRRRMIREAREMTDEERQREWETRQAERAKERKFIIIAGIIITPAILLVLASWGWLVTKYPPLEVQEGNLDFLADFFGVVLLNCVMVFAAYVAVDALTTWFWRK